MSILLYQSPASWAEVALADFDSFLQDHASAEKKASGMAINMISHYPDRTRLVTVMTDLAIEELNHYREVIRLLHERKQHPGADAKDPYVTRLRQTIRKGSDAYFLDQLLIGGIIEARGAERFGLIAEALPPGKLQRFYRAITRSEARHYETFFELARLYFDADTVCARLDVLLPIEAAICAELPHRAALH
jgi:tRNA-(ms[2]io[6]A)-hydroxylase